METKEWGMDKANDANANRIKLIDCPEYGSLGELKQALDLLQK